jgi:uncharacterized protein YecT (DUF1311 family)
MTSALLSRRIHWESEKRRPTATTFLVCLVHAWSLGAALLLALPLVSRGAVAQTDTADPIDQQMNACLATKEAETTAGMRACVGKATAAWDQRLTEAYSRLIQTLDPASRALLQTGHRSWLAYRKKDAAFLNGPWRAQHGTLLPLRIEAHRLDELRARVRALEAYALGG